MKKKDIAKAITSIVETDDDINYVKFFEAIKDHVENNYWFEKDKNEKGFYKNIQNIIDIMNIEEESDKDGDDDCNDGHYHPDDDDYDDTDKPIKKTTKKTSKTKKGAK